MAEKAIGHMFNSPKPAMSVFYNTWNLATPILPEKLKP